MVCRWGVQLAVIGHWALPSCIYIIKNKIKKVVYFCPLLFYIFL